MNYTVLFLDNNKIRHLVEQLGAAIHSSNDSERLVNIISSLKHIEVLLGLTDDEQIGNYLDNLLSSEDYDNIMAVLTERIELLKELCEEFECKNPIDEKFCALYNTILGMGYEALDRQMIDNFNTYYVSDTNNANALLTSYNRTLYWGALDYWKENYELIHNRAASLVQNADDMIWMYLSLEDYTSKEVMYQVLHNWITFSHEDLHEMPRNKYHQYFDYDIIGGSCGKVFVDAGACKGDTVDSLVTNFRNYEKVYSYEITPDTYEILVKNVSKYRNVICRRCGIAAEAGSMYVDLCEDIGGNRLGNSGEIEVPVVTLDEDISEKIDFIKMDIEGAEYDALVGAKRHIIEEHPILAISAYHNNVDIFRLARLINQMEPRYRFYYRYYGGTLYPNDYVLYAVIPK